MPRGARVVIRLLPSLATLLVAFSLGTPASAVQGRALHGKVSVSKEGSGSGTVTSDPAGIDCGDSCLFAFPSSEQTNYQPVTLTASADPGSSFAGWGGACSGTGGCTIDPLKELVTYDVTARFDATRPSSFPLAVSTSGQGKVSSDPAGIACGKTCSASFPTDSSVRLTAAPTPGWSFAGWSGACFGAGPCTVTMDGPKSVAATFAPPETSYALAASASAAGRVVSDPEGIECGASCAGSFGSGITVTLRAIGEGVSWSGDCAGSGASCALTMDGPKAVSVAFGGQSPAGFPVAIGKVGKGRVTGDTGGLDCGASCGAVFPAGASVTMTAKPDAGWRLAGWRGSCSGISPTCRLTASGPRTAVATFVEEGTRFPLAVTTSGTGTVTSVPSGIACRAACSAMFLAGTAVRLRATPAKGSKLVRWSGACSGGRPTCSVGIDGAKSVSATFARNADQTAPKVTALPSSGTRGQPARLRYRVRDESGKSREWASVYRGARRLATVHGPLDEADASVLFYFLRWRVPAAIAPGTLRFCVTGEDATGNRSKPSCARLTIR